MRFKRREVVPSVALALLMTATLIELGMVIPKVEAYTPTVANAGTGDWTAGSSFTVSVTIAAVGDTVEVMAGWRCQVGATPYCINSVSSLTSPGVTGGFTELRSVQNICYGNTTDGQCGGVIGSNWNSEMSAWTGTATSTGSIVITVNLASSGLANGGAIAHDIQFSSGTAFVASLFCAARAASSCQYPVPLATTGSPGQLMIAGITAWSATTGSTAACNYNTPTHTQFAAAWLAPVAPAAGAACSFALTGNTGFETGYAVIDLIYSSSATTTTVTSVINTGCLGACSGGANATSMFTGSNGVTLFSLFFYASQNQGSLAQIDNVTLKVAAVHINSATGTALIGVYSSGTTQPGGGNPYVLITPPVSVTLTNGTSNFFIHANPQITICASCYYAVTFMATTVKSNSQTVHNSGISLYESSQTGITQYQFSQASSTLPLQFYSNTVLRPNFFMFIHDTFIVGTVTTTSTTTITAGTIATSTTTTTLTSTNVVNQLNLASANFWFLPMLFLLAPMALLIGIKRVANGG